MIEQGFKMDDFFDLIFEILSVSVEIVIELTLTGKLLGYLLGSRFSKVPTKFLTNVYHYVAYRDIFWYVMPTDACAYFLSIGICCYQAYTGKDLAKEVAVYLTCLLIDMIMEEFVIAGVMDDPAYSQYISILETISLKIGIVR